MWLSIESLLSTLVAARIEYPLRCPTLGRERERQRRRDAERQRPQQAVSGQELVETMLALGCAHVPLAEPLRRNRRRQQQQACCSSANMSNRVCFSHRQRLRSNWQTGRLFHASARRACQAPRADALGVACPADARKLAQVS